MDKYEEALERAKELHEAGNALTKSQMEIVFPELKESEDERIRTRLIALVEAFGQGEYKDEMLAYLERQKEQQPAEWSEGDEGMLNCIIATLCEESHGGRETNDKMVTWLENRLKSLRPQPHWKPSEEQMKALKLAYEDAFDCPEGGVPHLPLQSLYQDLQKLL